MKLLKEIKAVSTYAFYFSMAGALAIGSPIMAEDTVVSSEVKPSDEVPGNPPSVPDKPNGSFDESSGSSVETTASVVVDGTEETVSNQEIVATESNQSVIKVTNGGSATIRDVTLNKASGEMTVEEASDFFGANAGILANAGSEVNLMSFVLKTATAGGNGVFATGEGTVINVSNGTIETTGDHARGLDATYTATIHADHMTIATKGAHCAAVATDRGEGTITVNESSLNTEGEGSPCIYSTGDITATSCNGTALGASLAVIEGKNAISLKNCDLKAYAKGRGNGGIDDAGVMVYQSMSGDATTGKGSFTATGSTLEVLKASEQYETAPMFVVTNTEAQITLTQTNLNYGSGILLKAIGNEGEWGTAGANGGKVNFEAYAQNLQGDVLCDAISQVDLSLNQSSCLKGAVDEVHTGEVSLSLDTTSSWAVTADSYITSLVDEDESLSNIISGGFTVYYDATNEANEWLGGASIALSDGGYLKPMAN